MSGRRRQVLRGAETGERLDRFLARRLDEPRNQVQRWIEEGRVEVDGRTARKSSQGLETSSEVVCEPPEAPAEDPRVEPEAGPLAVLYEDEHLVFLNKPSGLVVHPGAGHSEGTLVHRLLARYPEMAGVGGPGRPGIVHRLDQGTTGVMVVARTPRAYRGLSAAFQERKVGKTYLAVAYGEPREPAGTVEAPLGRHPERRQEMAVRPRGRRAVSHYRALASAGGLSLLEVEIETGRTHQIRVHLKHLGHPLVGDPVYGERRWKGLPKHRHPRLKAFPRPALHAWKLSLPHPAEERTLTVTAPVPADLVELWERSAGAPWPLPGAEPAEETG